MGNKHGVFTNEKLEELQDCTYFSVRKIKRLYKRFAKINPQRINQNVADFETKLALYGLFTAGTLSIISALSEHCMVWVSFSDIQNLPEMSENPFKSRICEVFSSSGSGMTFLDFLDMCSVFSERAPWDLKAAYAFRVYDFNTDAHLCQSDLEEMLISITDDGLEGSEISSIVEYVLKEADLNQDGKLSYAEFEHVISRAPDFINLFKISF